MKPGDPYAPNPWAPVNGENPWAAPPPTQTAAPAEPVVAPPRQGEILSLDLQSTGASEVERVFFPAPWYNVLEESFRWAGVGKVLGYQGSKTVVAGLFVNTNYAAGLFAFEAIAEYIVPKDKSFPIWKAYASNVLATCVDNTNATRIILDHADEFEDGPHGQDINLYGFLAGDHNKAYAFDAPRLSGEFGAGNTYSFRGDWRLKASTKIDAWQVKFHVEFSFSDAAPDKGSGSLTILEAGRRL